MPLGYRIVGGKAEIVPETAQIVREIFTDYLNGTSTYQIAKNLTAQGVPNASHRPSWSHGPVGLILENQKYKGDGFYPQLIETQVFEQVQARRREKAESLGRTAQLNSFKNQSRLGGKMVCGICGQPYRKYVEHCNQPSETVRWKCKRYIKSNRVYCRNHFLTERQIETAFLEVINRIITTPVMMEQAVCGQPEAENAASRKLTEKIQECLETGWYSTDEIRMLAYELARERYRMSTIHDGAYQTEKLKEAIAGKEIQTEFDSALFQQTVQKIIVYEDGRLRFYLINGVTIDANIQEYHK